MADRQKQQDSAAILRAMFRAIWPAIGVAAFFAWLTSVEIVGLAIGAAIYMVVAAWQLGTFGKVFRRPIDKGR